HAGTGTTLPTSGTAALYYHRNQQYSIVGLSDAAGTLVERYAYTAYGELTILAPDRTPRATSSFENRYTYTAREWDPTLRLYYFRARWLEPKAGRFIGRDPLGYVDGMGLYGAYFNLDHVDPYGTEKVTIIFNAFINGAIRGEWHDEPMAGFRPQDVFYAGFQANVQRQFRSNFRDFGEFDRGVENAKLYSIAEFDSNEIGNLESSSFVKSNGAGLSKQRWRWFWPHWGSTKVDYGQWNGPIELRPHIEPNEIEVEDLDKNTSKLTFSAGSKYPHVSVLGHNPSPPIDYKVSFTVTKICDWEYRGVLVELSGSRDRFPDYEAYAYESSRPASTFYEFFSPDKGPGFHNLGKPMDQPVSGSELIVFEYF
ncbi:MAG: RHS repeat domain-containing protein, partial [Planctomycetota bacterium]